MPAQAQALLLLLLLPLLLLTLPATGEWVGAQLAPRGAWAPHNPDHAPPPCYRLRPCILLRPV